MSTKITKLDFDASKVAPAVALEPIPASKCGFHPVVISEAAINPTKDAKGQRLALTFTINDGEFKGRKVFDGLNIKNANAQAQEIAHQQLSAIAHAINTVHITDVGQLLNKPFLAKIGYDEAKDGYEAKNTFKGAKPLGASAAPAAGPVASKPEGWGKTDAAPAPKAPPAKAPPVKTPPPAPADTRKFEVYNGEGLENATYTATELAAAIASGTVKQDGWTWIDGGSDAVEISTIAASLPTVGVPAAAGGPPKRTAPWKK